MMSDSCLSYGFAGDGGNADLHRFGRRPRPWRSSTWCRRCQRWCALPRSRIQCLRAGCEVARDLIVTTRAGSSRRSRGGPQRWRGCPWRRTSSPSAPSAWARGGRRYDAPAVGRCSPPQAARWPLPCGPDYAANLMFAKVLWNSKKTFHYLN